jgi:hypothetical protein
MEPRPIVFSGLYLDKSVAKRDGIQGERREGERGGERERERGEEERICVCVYVERHRDIYDKREEGENETKRERKKEERNLSHSLLRSLFC